MYLSKETIRTLKGKLKELNKLRPISSAALKKLREQFQLEMTYNSNAIEGNSLTMKETFRVINEGITFKNKPLKDHLEATDHQTALEFLYELIDSKRSVTFSEHLIKQLHQLIMMRVDKEIAGRYRHGNVMITGTDHVPPQGIEVPSKMNEMIDWLNKNRKKYHIVELAAILHHKFVHIHPFSDGNGRTGRLVMNVMIMHAGYPICIILKNDRRKYYNALSYADHGKYKPLCEFIAQNVLRSLNIYLNTLTPYGPKKEKFISLKKLSEGSPYSAQYLRKLVSLGKLEGYKEKRDWLSSKEALKKYMKR